MLAHVQSVHQHALTVCHILKEKGMCMFTSMANSADIKAMELMNMELTKLSALGYIANVVDCASSDGLVRSISAERTGKPFPSRFVSHRTDVHCVNLLFEPMCLQVGLPCSSQGRLHSSPNPSQSRQE